MMHINAAATQVLMILLSIFDLCALRPSQVTLVEIHGNRHLHLRVLLASCLNMYIILEMLVAHYSGS